MSYRGSRGRHARPQVEARGASRVVRRSLLALVLVPAMALQVVSSTSASAADVQGFEIDGNVTDDPGGGTDWNSLPGTRTTDPTGQVDPNFTGGSKEFMNPEDWKEGLGTSTNQGDISDVYSHFVQGSQSWAFLGFRRIAESGTMTFMVEFNQKANLPKETGDTVQFRPDRSVNDLLLRFEQDGNGVFSLTAAYKWTQSAGGTFASGCFVVPGYDTPSAWCPTSLTGSGFAGATGEGKLFAEGAVNLSAFDTLGDCRGAYGVMNVRSFAGNDEKSSLLDFVGGIGINVLPTCGALKIEKRNKFGEPVPGMTFTISPNPVPGSGAGDLVVTDGGANDPDGTADGIVLINPAKPGTYTVTESVPAGAWDYIPPAELSQQKTVVAKVTEPVVFTFVNKLKFQPLSIDTAVNPTKVIDYEWKVAKSVDKTRIDIAAGGKAVFNYTVDLKAMGKTASGHEVKGSATVTNPNDRDIPATISLSSTGATDCQFSPDPDVNPAQPGVQVLVAKNSSPSYAFTCTPEPNHAGGSVTATVTWDGNLYPQGGADPTYTRSDTASYTSYAVRQEIDKTTDVRDHFNDAGLPGADEVDELLGTVSWNDAWNTFPVVAKSFTYQREISGVVGKCTTYDNQAKETADGTTASQSVTVCVGADLEIDKVATLAYDREYMWKVTKTGPGHLFVGENGGTASFDVKLETNGFKDTDWSLGGTIWISNPNSWEVEAHIEDVTTLDGKQLTCFVTGGADVTVPANADKRPYAYTCSGVEQGAYDGSNTATVTWDKTEYFTPSGSAAKTVAVQVSEDTSPANATVSLSDVFDGGAATPIGATSYTWSEVKANPVTVTYTRPVTAPVGGCRTYDNTVTVVGPGISDSERTVVCQPGLEKSVEASYGQRQTWTLKKEVDKTFVELGPNDTVTFNYTVTATPGAVVDEGQASWSGVITVKNPSTTEVFNGTVTDTPDVAGWTCQIVGDGKVSVQPGGTANVSYTCSTAGNTHPDGENTATVSWPGHSTATTVDVEFDSTGTIDTKATLTDDIVGDGLPAKEFEVDATKGPNVFTYSNSTLTASAGTCATWTNHAVLQVTGADPTDSATVKVCREAPLTVEVDGAGSYGVTYPWGIDKVLEEPRTVEVDAETGQATFDYEVVVTAGAKQAADWTMGGTVSITNPNTYAEGAITVTDVDVTTDVGGGAVCTPTMPEAPIAPGATIGVPYTCTFTGDPATSGSVSAVVEWDPAGPDASDTASNDADVELKVGEEVDKTIEVWDDKTDPENPVLLGELTWADGLVKSYEYSLTHDGVPGTCVAYTNTAWLELPSADSPGLDEGDPSASTTATVCAESPLTASIEAAGGLARDYGWSIDKDVDKTSVTITGGSATFNYTVVVRAGASKDSAWRASGVVTVSNPNTYEDGDITLTGASITNTFGPGVTCAPNAAVAGTVVPVAGEGPGTVGIPFTCTFANAPTSNTGTISAEVTWDPAGEAASDTASASTGVALGLDKETNKVVDVVDDKTVPGRRIELEKGLVWAAGLVKTYTYSLSLPAGAAGTTTPYTNIATVDLPEGPDVSDTVTVTVAVPEVLPEQEFGKATGKVRASCQGTVTARMRNATGARVTYVLKVGKKTHRIKVGSGKRRVFQTKGAARSRVVLKVGRQTLDRVRVPKLCLPPEVLPETGLRAAANARLASIAERWR